MVKIEPRYLLVKIAKILEELKIPYLVTGGMAILVWGRPRFTADIDIIIRLKSENVDKLEKALKALGETGYIDKEAIEEALLRRGEFNFIDGESGIKVDFWIISEDSFSLSELKRRIVKKILGQKIYFISPEDLILNKLKWYKQTESNRHLEDIESIFKISGEKLNKNYLKQQAEKLGFLDILKQYL